MEEDFNHCYINSLATQKYIQKNNYKKKKLSELKKRLYYIKIDENMQTSINKVFAGGDIVGQKATVAWASRSGRDAAEKILKITCNIM